ncbi:MAG: dihydroorotase [Defluviitaleaceae bacterium]|nr:dihydroorotase [Defluviitaleaceae bacterium]
MAKILIKNGRIINPANNIDRVTDILVEGNKIASIGDGLVADNCEIIDAESCWVTPGLIDLHVHFREPGQTHKEDIASGSAAAAMGGFTTVCVMPNTAPIGDSVEWVHHQIARGKEVSLCDILPIAAITIGQKGEELAPIADMVAAGAVGISEDGMSVKNANLLKDAMKIAAKLGVAVFSHCEDASLANGGVMSQGKISKKLGLRGIPHSAEDVIIARDIMLARETGAKLHICHVATQGGAELIADAKKRTTLVTAEIAPHHFILSDEDIDGTNTNFKMNPPLRTKADVAAMLEALADGTLDAIATDHAPHHADEKAKGFLAAPNGIVGLEISLSLAITELVETGRLTPLQLIEKMSAMPAKILGINKGNLAVGSPADITIIDPKAKYTIDPANFVSRGENMPFGGREVVGKVRHTIYGGKFTVKDGRLV